MARRKAESAPTCQYTYKVCSNLRSTKRNGSLHLLCDYHRKKANAIQRAYAAKKRQQQQPPRANVAAVDAPPVVAKTTPRPTPQPISARATNDTKPAPPVPAEKTKKKKEAEPTMAFKSVLDTLVPPSFPSEEPPPEYPMWEYLETILFET